MTYRELLEDIESKKVSAGSLKLHLNRHAHIYHKLTRAALKKFINEAIDNSALNLDNRCIWMKKNNDGKANTYELKLNY